MKIHLKIENILFSNQNYTYKYLFIFTKKMNLNTKNIPDQTSIDDWESFQEESDEVRNIILLFKIRKCSDEDHFSSSQYTNSCSNYHSTDDKRRRPFDNNGKLLYSSESCQNKSCNDDKCKFANNLYEVNYHPNYYKTKICNIKHKFEKEKLSRLFNKESISNFPIPIPIMKSSILSKFNQSSRTSDFSSTFFTSEAGNYSNNKSTSDLNLTQVDEIYENEDLLELDLDDIHDSAICPFYHSTEDRRNNKNDVFNLSKASILSVIQLNHMNLLDFKVKKCELTVKHSEKECVYYHSNKDKRRCQRKYTYTHDLCSYIQNESKCPKNDHCHKSHNQVEMFYHKDKFKTKLCSYFHENSSLKEINSTCPYGLLCSFAHAEDELQIPLFKRTVKNEAFFMFSFKTISCPYIKQHDKSSCEYYHNFQDHRRNPNKYFYTKTRCSNWNNKNTILDYKDGCHKGYSCDMTHGWKEYDFHPLVYKTIKCKSTYNDCDKKGNCPFFHSNEDMRIVNENDEFSFWNKSKKKLNFNENPNKMKSFQLNFPYNHQSLGSQFYPYNTHNNKSFIQTQQKNLINNDNISKNSILINNLNNTKSSIINQSKISKVLSSSELQNFECGYNSFLFPNTNTSNISLFNRQSQVNPSKNQNFRTKNIFSDSNLSLKSKNDEANFGFESESRKVSQRLSNITLDLNNNDSNDKIIRYLYSKNLRNLLFSLQSSQISVENLLKMTVTDLEAYIEEENSDKISDLKEFLSECSKDDNLKEISQLFEKWN